MSQSSSDDARLLALVEALERPEAFPHPVERFERIATHISYVLLTGRFAYKFKRPVALGFLDFGTLEKRRHYCEEELRLNHRLAPELYLEVAVVTGSAREPVIGGCGEALEYAVRMREFPAEARLDRVLEAGGLSRTHVDDACEQLAAFHRAARVATADEPYGDPPQVAEQMLENFEHFAGHLEEPALERGVRELKAWTEGELERLGPTLEMRKRLHRVRECHGDLHLANMALIDGRVVIFDCIEFNEHLRWIDVMSEVAFLMMDLDYRSRAPLAHRFLNGYLERSGDYEGVAVLDLYRAYRALVRAKVALIRSDQAEAESTDAERARRDAMRHVGLARQFTERASSAPLIITHGLSGSGKTTVSERLVELAGAVRVRSDVERKRLAGLDWRARSASALDAGLYAPAMTERTYARLIDLARAVLACGRPVIVDAAFLARAERERFRALARGLGAPFRILEVGADRATLEARVAARERAGDDASEAGGAVLARQLRSAEPLAPEERRHAIPVDTTRSVDYPTLADQLAKK